MGHAVIALAHELGLIVVAEGVEDADVAARLVEFGCDVVQGFYFSVPLSADDVLRRATEAADPIGAGTPVTSGTERS